MLEEPKDIPTETPVLPASNPEMDLELGHKPEVDELNDVSVDLAAANTADPPPPPPPEVDDSDPYGDESGADIKFKTMSWQWVVLISKVYDDSKTYLFR